MRDVAAFDAGDYPLHPVPTALWEGFVFLSLAHDPEPFETSFADLLGKFGRCNLPDLKPARRIAYEVRANWKLIFENYSECYHCPSVHPALVRLSPADSGANDLTAGAFLGGYMTVRPGYESMTLSGRACGLPVGDLPAEEMQRIYYYSIFPNLLLSLHPDYVMAHTIWPEAPDRTRIECEWLFHADSARDPAYDPEDAVGFWDRTNREDWHICERSHLGIASRAYTPGPYSPREGISAAFDREYLRAMEASA
jgi:Rieske 2Fe-2S family protein